MAPEYLCQKVLKMRSTCDTRGSSSPLFNCLFPKTGFGYRGAFNWKILRKDCVNASQWTYLNLNWTACFLASFIPHYNQEEATWSGRLPCAFFQSLPSGIPLPQPIIMMPYSIHQNNPSVVPSTPKCQSKKKVPPNGRGENEIFEFTAWLRTLVQKRTIQVPQPIVGNGKKSHDRQLDTLLPEPKSIRYPENRQITVSRRKKMGFNQEKVNTHTCASFLKDAKMHWHWQIKMSKLSTRNSKDLKRDNN